jgi:hypothetical protein
MIVVTGMTVQTEQNVKEMIGLIGLKEMIGMKEWIVVIEKRIKDRIGIKSVQRGKNLKRKSKKEKEWNAVMTDGKEKYLIESDRTCYVVRNRIEL